MKEDYTVWDFIAMFLFITLVVAAVLELVVVVAGMATLEGVLPVAHPPNLPKSEAEKVLIHAEKMDRIAEEMKMVEPVAIKR